MYATILLANNILDKAFAEKRSINLMQLQKMLYLTASIYAHNTGRQLLTEQFSTWAYGPVLCSVNYKFACFGSKPITKFARSTGSENPEILNVNHEPGLAHALNTVWHSCKDLSGVQLAELTRLPGSSWDNAFQAGQHALAPDDIAIDTTYFAALGLGLKVA